MPSSIKSLLIATLFFSLTGIAYSKGIFGTYTLTGKVYDSDGNVLKHQWISVNDGTKTHRIQSDEQGNYSFKVFYGTPCRSALRGASYRKALREMNPRVLVFSCNDRSKRFRTNWKKGSRKQTIEHTLRFN